MVDHKKKIDDVEVVVDTNERSLDDSEIGDIESKSAEKLRSVRDSLKVCEAEKAQYLEDLQRARADFLNSKRRLNEQFERDKERIIEKMVKDMLPLIDSFETALSRKEEDEKGHWQKGVEAMHAQFLSILKSYNITEIETDNATFNPHEHDAVTTRPGEQGEVPDTVLQVLQKGYKRGDTVIRPAKVVIAT